MYKNKSHYSSLNRIYSFENSINGGLGPQYFLDKIYKKPINKIINNYDLLIYILLNKNDNNLISKIKNKINNKNVLILYDKNINNIIAKNKIYITDDLFKINKKKDYYLLYNYDDKSLNNIISYFFTYFYYK